MLPLLYFQGTSLSSATSFHHGYCFAQFLCTSDCATFKLFVLHEVPWNLLSLSSNHAMLVCFLVLQFPDHKFRPRHGAHESRQSRRGNFIWAHRACAQWSEGVFSDHGKLIGVDEAVLRGLSERCCICQNTGATITCRSARCRHAYHLPCAALDSSYLVRVCSEGRTAGCRMRLRGFTGNKCFAHTNMPLLCIWEQTLCTHRHAFTLHISKLGTEVSTFFSVSTSTVLVPVGPNCIQSL